MRGLSYKTTGNNGLSHEVFDEKLNELGLIKTQIDRFVDYHLYSNDGKSYDLTTESILKTAVTGIENVIDKSLLPEVMQHHMAKNYKLIDVIKRGVVVQDGLFILKPIGKGAFGGKGIQILQKGDKPKLERRWKYSLSEYVTNIMLFQGKKFHLRVYLFVSTWGKWKLYPKYRIITAKLPYTHEDWTNKDIHDTHLGSTEGDYFFFNDGDIFDEEIDNQIQVACNDLMQFIHPKSYPESKDAYEMLGLDFLISDKGIPILLEVNNGAGIHLNTNWYKDEVINIYIEFLNDYFK